MFAKSPHSDSYDYFLKGDDGEFHRVGWATTDSIKVEPSENEVIPSLHEPCEFSATVQVNPEFAKQLTEEMRRDIQGHIEMLDKVIAGLNSCIFGHGEKEACQNCPYQPDHYNCRLHLFLSARNAIHQYRKVYEQMLPKEDE